MVNLSLSISLSLTAAIAGTAWSFSFSPTKSNIHHVGIRKQGAIKKHSTKTTSTSMISKPRSISSNLYMGLGDLPFFATIQPEAKEGTASITTRLPLGKIFDSRDYIFSTATNVRSYEWTLKEAEELLDDLIDATMGIFGNGMSKSYELSQIVLVPMEWDRDAYGLGGKFDVHDGQQRLVTLCLLIAALRDAFDNDGSMEDTVIELSNMLSPPKTRKKDVLRIELNKRDNEVLSRILNNEQAEIETDLKPKFKKMSKANKMIYDNYTKFKERIGSMTKDERLKLLDFLVENVYMLVCVPENSTIARSLVMSQGKGKDNEPIDDFKGLVCFRYNENESDMYKTFDAWDVLASMPDLDNGSVGRTAVADACLLRASAEMRNKIRKSDQVYSFERWLRHDIIENKHEGHVFYKMKIEPASLYLGQYREGEFDLFGFYPRNKGTKAWKKITMRLRFLRDMTNNIASTKEVEMIVLELLLRTGAMDGNKKKAMILSDLDDYLDKVEVLAMWMALTRPSPSERYEKVFAYLDAIDAGKNKISAISEEDKSSLREALVVSEFGSNTSGKKIATAILKRLNAHVLAQNGNEDAVSDTADTYLESILPLKATKKAWGEDWPDQDERNKWVDRLGNLALISDKATARERKMSFDEKKKRFRAEVWPLTSGLNDLSAWNSDNLVKQLASTVALIDQIWGL